MTPAALLPQLLTLLCAEAPPSFDFVNDVVPVLTRSSCNAASCHGAALGQGGFKLSLLGNDPEADHVTITRELSGRRIDRADPASSLLLRKPTRQMPHRGGRVLEVESQNYAVLLEWARNGFQLGHGGPGVVGLKVSGPIDGRLVVDARYSDGSGKDVTRLALFSSNDDAIAEVNRDGDVKLKNPGETTIMVRFAGHVGAARVGKPFDGLTDRKPLGGLRSSSFVDERIGQALERIGLTASPPCDDAAFARRAFLDVIGTLPRPEEVRAFLSRPDRSKLLAELIARPEFDTYWAYRLDQIFQVSSKRISSAAAPFHAWLKSRVKKPWAETARLALTACGSAPETGFYRLTADPKEMSENTGRIFLGSRWQCAQCHDHPFERFRQQDYFGLAAMFARVRHTDEGIVSYHRGEVTFPRTGKDALPVFPDGSQGDVDGDRRLKLADWVASNPQLRRSFANRIWALLMGRGLVQPVDDFRASNPPSHPELLDELSRLETIPELVSVIANSAAYGLSGATDSNRQDRRFYSHFFSRPLAAEVLVDAIALATGIPDSYPDRPAGTRAIELGDFAVPSYTLDVCGRNRPGFEASLPQALHLLNGEAVDSKLRCVGPLLASSNADLVEELYLRTLSRLPTSDEADHWQKTLDRGPRAEIGEDLLWALLNSRELATCH